MVVPEKQSVNCMHLLMTRRVWTPTSLRTHAEFMLPGIINTVPSNVLPSVVLNKDWHPIYLGNARRYKEARGIVVKTLMELESHVINAFSDGKTPPLYHGMA